MKYLLGLVFLMTSAFGSDSMVKVVYRIQGPTIEMGDYAGLPRTVYRVDDRMGRVEETRDADFGMHALIILNHQDVWMINRVTSVGMHFNALDPERGFRVPIVPSVLPLRDQKAERFEIGRELVFMAERGIDPEIRTEDCNHYQVYETLEDGLTLTVYCSPESGLPLRSEVREADQILVEIAYDQYETGLPIDARLFVPDEGLEITEHSRAPQVRVASTAN